MNKTTEALKCPECESDRVTLTAEQAWMANTGEYWCETVKTQDADAKATCLDCRWVGRHDKLTGYGKNQDD